MTRRRQAIIRWWRAPSSYSTAVEYTTAIGLRRPMEILVGLLSLVYGLAAALSAAYFITGAGTAFGMPVALIVAATSLIIGAQWARGVGVSERWSLAFLLYGDVAVILVVLCYADTFTAWPGLALLAANGTYAAFHHHAPAVAAHFIVATGAMIWCAGASLAGGTDPVLVAVRGLVLFPSVIAVSLLVVPAVRILNVDAIGAHRDSLTGLRNRRGLFASAAEHASRGEAVSVLVLDVDKFKAINDQFGHLRGDEVLSAIGSALTTAAPDNAVTARIGGEEFAILLPGTDVDGVAERIHECELARRANIPITVSIGVASTPRLVSADALTALLDRADAAMYRAKANGGRQTVIGR